MASVPTPSVEKTERGGELSSIARWIRAPLLILIAAIAAGALLGTFEIANTSIGWHLASGRWMVEHRAFLRADPFTFTSGGASWINHEWLFQLVAAVVDSLGGAPLLVILRSVTVAVLAVLLLIVGLRNGLSPSVALVLAVLCVCGARPRFFLRPELVTLLVVPTVVWLFLERDRWQSRAWLGVLGGLMVVGANSHGGVLVIPVLLAGVLAADTLQMAVMKSWNQRTLKLGAAAGTVAVLAMLINPYGWRLFTAPLHLANLVGLPHIPNPEWVSPSPSQAPFLYLGIVVAVLILALKERRGAYWILLALASALALRHIRNLGLFFVLLPLIVAPSLAKWRALTSRDPARIPVRQLRLFAVGASLALAVVVATGPWPRFGLSYAAGFYPAGAVEFLEREQIPTDRMYNDVRFGGFLIDHLYPSHQVFQDDRNEINEPLLREIWAIFQRSDVAAWDALLSRFEVTAALVRYHQPLRVTTPEGADLGTRGFSALWFPDRLWALVYWDDVVMVFVHREHSRSELIGRAEYRAIRPDDLAHLEQRLKTDPELRARAAQEVRRALAENPTCHRARTLAAFIDSL